MKKGFVKLVKEMKDDLLGKAAITAGMGMIMVAMYAMTAGVIVQHSGDYLIRKIKQGVRNESSEHR
ncbi:MAG: hypothetical protein IPJ69_07480 [Deltaproteobacteria bacterium]|nr:MAG: hypothetical protein IPJ69_07480 [Deltaproteobacteria bacterium]